MACCTLTFVLVNNNKDLDLGANNEDKDCTRPVKSEANKEGSCFLGDTRVLGLSSQANLIVL
jgi:hypothetical protein